MIKVEKCEYRGIQYLKYYPKDYVEGKQYPVFYHLHGAGGRGRNFEAFSDSSVLQTFIGEGSPLNKAFCIIPQCSGDTWNDVMSELLDLTKHIYNQPFTDKKHFVGSGISMGGYAIYAVMMALPELFNKAIICCGGGMYWNAGRLKDIKIRIFHGEKDEVVYPEEARRMYQRLKEVGADVSLTIYPECDHNSWDKTYSNKENLEWLLR